MSHEGSNWHTNGVIGKSRRHQKTYIIWFTANIYMKTHIRFMWKKHINIKKYSIYCIWKHNLHLSLYVTLNHCFSLEVGMRFQVLHSKSETKCCVVEVNQWWKLWCLLYVIIECKSIHYFACGVEIALSTTERSRAHTRIVTKMRLKLWTMMFNGRTTVLAI